MGLAGTVLRVNGMPGVSTERSARRWLHRLHTEIGKEGLAAAAVIPGLAAVVDQHAAAVRDATTVGLEASAAVAGLALLASYAQGVLDHARNHGWTRPAAGSWSTADWISVRLVAVCVLARAHAQRSASVPPPLDPPG